MIAESYSAAYMTHRRHVDLLSLRDRHLACLVGHAVCATEPMSDLLQLVRNMTMRGSFSRELVSFEWSYGGPYLLACFSMFPSV